MNQGIKKTFIAGVFWGVLEKFSVLFVGFLSRFFWQES